MATTTTSEFPAPHLTPVSLSSTQTAVGLLPPPSLYPSINTLRSLYDKRYKRWMPHITVVFPFVPESALPAATEQLRSAVAAAGIEDFEMDFEGAGNFEHRRNATVFLKPAEESARMLKKLRTVLVGPFTEEREEEFTPHLTVGQTSLDTAMEDLLAKADKLAKGVKWRADRVAVLRRLENGDMMVVEEIALGEENDAVEEVVEVESEWKGCYEWKEGWRVVETKEELLERDVSVGTYNVYDDINAPPVDERFPLLKKAILTVKGEGVRVLCLQEMTDELLMLLLSDTMIRESFPYTSHSPDNVLPSKRNTIILASAPFATKFIPFPFRHKGALLASFSGFVVASIHLSSALSDRTVAAKATQMETLTSYLKSECSHSEWIVAGDFNLVTSSKTLQSALEQELISEETARVARQEVIDTEIFADAWDIAAFLRTETEEGLYPGEEGATFTRLSNKLAASGIREGSDLRPQRYDRVLFRKTGNVLVKAVDRFGIEEDECGSDHYGVVSQFTIERSEEPAVEMEQIDVIEDSTDLLPYIADSTPSEEDRNIRKTAIEVLAHCLARPQADDDEPQPTLDLVLAPLGSYALDVYDKTADVDLLAISSISRKVFFALARERINASAGAVRSLRYVDAVVPMLELRIGELKVDLQYCQAPSLLTCWPQVATSPSNSPIFTTLNPISLRPLNAYRDMQHILHTLPNIHAFRTSYRFLHLWLKRTGLYSSRFGYIGGIHLALLLSRVCKLAGPSASPASLVRTFVHYYAHFPWSTRAVCDPGKEEEGRKYSISRPMTILGIFLPTVRHNVAQNATRLSTEALSREFQRAEECFEENATGAWGELTRKDGVQKFLREFGAFVRVQVDIWSASRGKTRGFIGRLESLCPNLLVELGKSLPNLTARIYPSRFYEPDTTTITEDSTSDLHGYYLIGVNSTSTSAESKRAVLSKLVGSLKHFEDQIKGTTLFDKAGMWVGVELVKRDGVGNIELDSRDWGADPGFNDIADDDDDDEDDTTPPSEPTTSTPPPRKSKQNPISDGTPKPKLRPAHDVLNRLRWDPAINQDDYIVGYEDRFKGVMEIELRRWKTEETEREFVPMHRVVYFRTRGRREGGATNGGEEGVRVWDREGRVDVIFGSG